MSELLHKEQPGLLTIGQVLEHRIVTTALSTVRQIGRTGEKLWACVSVRKGSGNGTHSTISLASFLMAPGSFQGEGKAKKGLRFFPWVAENNWQQCLGRNLQ